MRYFPGLLLAAALAGCASGSPSGTVSTPVANAPTRVIGASETNSDVVINPDVAVVRTALPVAPARAFAALPLAYGDLAIPVTRTDPERLLVGNPRLAMTGRLAGEPMSHWFDCGRGGLGGPLADAYRMRIGLQTTVVPVGTGSEVQTVATATAQSPDGSSSYPVVCNSTGRLEQRLVQLLRVRLGQ